MLLGAGSFWLPVVFIEVSTRRELGVLVGLVVPFASELAIYLLAMRVWKQGWPPLALYMCLGFYVLGPTLAAIGYSALGGGFAKPGGWAQSAKFLALFSIPPLGLEFAGPQAIPMLLSTIVMVWMYFKIEKGRSGESRDAAPTRSV